jgi:rSAM/selenodomain-associated transferase 1
MKEALIVFAKPPVAGRVKTRLYTLLSPDEAAQLYEAFLDDSLDQYGSLGRDVFLYLSDASKAYIESRAQNGIITRGQQGQGLGQRMSRAFLDLFLLGYQSLVVIGTDHPSLPSAFVDRAFEELREPRSIVVGPAEDGGYYLLGMNDFFPVLFEDMTFSDEHVFEQTMKRAATTTGTVSVLPLWYDVDTSDQLPRLLRDLRASDAHAPRTRRLLETLQQKYGSKWS